MPLLLPLPPLRLPPPNPILLAQYPDENFCTVESILIAVKSNTRSEVGEVRVAPGCTYQCGNSDEPPLVPYNALPAGQFWLVELPIDDDDEKVPVSNGGLECAAFPAVAVLVLVVWWLLI